MYSGCHFVCIAYGHSTDVLLIDRKQRYSCLLVLWLMLFFFLYNLSWYLLCYYFILFYLLAFMYVSLCSFVLVLPDEDSCRKLVEI